MSEISQETSQAVGVQCVALAEALVARQYDRQPEIWQPFGGAGREKSLRHAQYHLSYLSAALNTGSPALFTDYVAWAKLISQVRASDEGRRLKIIVGGYPFNVAPELWRRVGADSWAHDAQQAVATANQLLTNGA